MWNLQVYVLVSSVVVCSALVVKINPLWDLVEGGKAELPCVVDSEEPGKVPEITFLKVLRVTAVVIKPTADKRIDIKRNSNGSVSTGTLILNKVEIGDETEDGYYCQGKVGSANRKANFQINVLPKKSEQVVRFVNKTTAVKGEPWSLACVANAKFSEKLKTIDLKASWHFSTIRGQAGATITSGGNIVIETSTVKTPNETTTTSKLTIKDVMIDNGGYYTCSVSQMLPKHYSHVINKTAAIDIAMSREMDAEDKVKVKKGSNAELVCKVGGFPQGSVEWSKDGKIVDGKKDRRVSFGNHNQVPNSILKISNTEFSDRGIYICNASNSGGSVTVKFILRIKDPLGPLWPFIGILIEIVILVIIIFVSEKYRVAAKRKAAAKDRTNPESATLLEEKEGPVV